MGPARRAGARGRRDRPAARPRARDRRLPGAAGAGRRGARRRAGDGRGDEELAGRHAAVVTRPAAGGATAPRCRIRSSLAEIGFHHALGRMTGNRRSSACSRPWARRSRSPGTSCARRGGGASPRAAADAPGDRGARRRGRTEVRRGAGRRRTALAQARRLSSAPRVGARAAAAQPLEGRAAAPIRYGLIGMRERTESLGGEFTVSSRPAAARPSRSMLRDGSRLLPLRRADGVGHCPLEAAELILGFTAR